MRNVKVILFTIGLVFCLLSSNHYLNVYAISITTENKTSEDTSGWIEDAKNCLVSNNISVQDIIITTNGPEIILDMNENEINNLSSEQMEFIHTIVTEKYMSAIFSEIVTTNEITPKARPKYENEYGPTVRKTFSGYAGNQPKGGNRFATGGGFYFQDNGGPSISISISYPLPYGNMTVGVSLGKSASSGKFVTVPDTIHYYKLYVEKTYDCRPYITYYTDSFGKKSVFFRGMTKVLYSQNQYAKKV